MRGRTYINSCWNGHSRLYSSDPLYFINSVLENGRPVPMPVGHRDFASSVTLVQNAPIRILGVKPLDKDVNQYPS